MLVAAVVRASAPARKAPSASRAHRTERTDAPTMRTPPHPSSVIFRPPWKDGDGKLVTTGRVWVLVGCFKIQDNRYLTAMQVIDQ